MCKQSIPSIAPAAAWSLEQLQVWSVIGSLHFRELTFTYVACKCVCADTSIISIANGGIYLLYFLEKRKNKINLQICPRTRQRLESS